LSLYTVACNSHTLPPDFLRAYAALYFIITGHADNTLEPFSLSQSFCKTDAWRDIELIALLFGNRVYFPASAEGSFIAEHTFKLGELCRTFIGNETMRQNDRNVFSINFLKIVPVVVVNNRHNIASLKTEQTLDLINIDSQEEFKFLKHVPENNINYLIKLTGTRGTGPQTRKTESAKAFFFRASRLSHF